MKVKYITKDRTPFNNKSHVVAWGGVKPVNRGGLFQAPRGMHSECPNRPATEEEIALYGDNLDVGECLEIIEEPTS